MRVRYLPDAFAEYEAAAAWYDDHNPTAGDDFVDAVERAEAVIAETPRAWPQWPNARPGTRRYLIPGFPFAVAFVLAEDEIVILAVSHQRRRPGYWFTRRVDD